MQKNKLKRSAAQHSRAFTLIEMLISISIFMIFIGIAANSYMSLASANKKANEMQKLYRDARFVFDTVSTEVRSGALDYSCLNGTDVHCLANLNSTNPKVIALAHNRGLQRTFIKYDEAAKNIMTMRQSRETTASAWPENEWEAVAPANFPLEDFSFSVFPLKNPYDARNAFEDEIQYQPSVTVTLKAGGFDFRTTYSSRTYGTKNLY